MFEQHACWLMIPIGEDDCAFFVVGVQEGVCLGWLPDDDGANESIDVLVFKVGVPPMSIISKPDRGRESVPRING